MITIDSTSISCKADPLLRKIYQCKSCPLAETRRNVILGRGEYPAEYLFIGESPSDVDDKIGLGFSGEIGKLLEHMLHDAKINKHDCLMTNVVLCHVADREPKPGEVVQCMENVLYVADLAEPRVVVFMGKVAEKYYKKSFPAGVTIQHPSLLLRTGGQQSPYYRQNIHQLEVARGE